MSLINQMLKDLDARRAGIPPDTNVQTSRGSATPPRRLWPTVLASVALTGLLAAGLGWWLGGAAPNRPQHQAGSESPQPVAASAKEVAEASPAPSQAEQGRTTTPAGSAKPPTTTDTQAPAPAQQTAAAATPESPAVAEPPAETVKLAAQPKHSAAAAKHPTRNPASSVAEQSSAATEPGSMQKASSQPKPAIEAQRAYADGRERLQHGDVAGAVGAWRQALQADASFHPAREALAVELLREGRAEAAAEVLRDGMQRFPAHAAYGERLARLQLASDDAQAAVATLQGMPAPALDADRDYYALLAAARQRSGDDAGAIAVYRQLTQAEPGNAAWWVGLALSLERSEQAAAARQAYARALQSPQRSATLEQFARQRLSQLPAQTQ